jgi:poly-gamma-glutamate capsule biosynthesis protein CapA/YwtB (metallophosphatase superfamily)
LPCASRVRGHRLLAGELQEIARGADLFILNLECCVSDRGQRVRDPGKRFFFRAPPVAAERLAEMRVSCVTLGNNHALDFGPDALRDTLDHLRAAGIGAVGAGSDDAAARRGRLRRAYRPRLPRGRVRVVPERVTTSGPKVHRSLVQG